MIFVDTSAWFAAVVPSDPNHSEAASWLTANLEPLLTTDYIVDETLTLLRARREPTRARVLGERFFARDVGEIYFLAEDDISEHGTCSSNTMTKAGVLPIAQAR